MKRPLKELLQILRCIHLDASKRCHTEMFELERDINYITSRVENEGLSFLTITMPRFSKDFENSLDEGCIGHKHFLGWKRFRCLPAFLRGFTHRIFDSNSGALYEYPDIESIKAIRQICLLVKKIKIPCTPAREEAAYSEYAQTEQGLQAPDWDSAPGRSYASVSSLLYQNIFSRFDAYSLVPNHGPGAVAEHYRPNQKFKFLKWYDKLNACFPYDQFACCSLNHMEDALPRLKEVAAGHEDPILIGSVPKTLVAPRIIGSEPCCMMYVQQSLKKYLYDTLETHPLTAGHVNFTDQSINQMLALTSSIDRKYATIDLSKASDMVLLNHVEVMLRDCPVLLQALVASRSERALLPGREISIELKKFAGMGSATCFPIEAMHFFAICVAALLDKRKLQHTLENIRRVSRDVYVYGDDIVVPTDEVEIVLSYFSLMGSVVNVSKTFFKGHFRESCGMDAYRGERVTPVYIRTLPPENKGDTQEFISWVSLGNQLCKAGYHRAFDLIKRNLDKKKFYGELPFMPEDEQNAIGWFNPLVERKAPVRYNRRLQRFEVKAPVVRLMYQRDKLNGWPALLRWFLVDSLANESTSRKVLSSTTSIHTHLDEMARDVEILPRDKEGKHLTRSPRRRAVGIRLCWVEHRSMLMAA